MYLGTDLLGGLYYSNHLEFDKAKFTQLFCNKPFTLKCKKGMLLAQTEGSEIVCLKMKMDG